MKKKTKTGCIWFDEDTCKLREGKCEGVCEQYSGNMSFLKRVDKFRYYERVWNMCEAWLKTKPELKGDLEAVSKSVEAEYPTIKNDFMVFVKAYFEFPDIFGFKDIEKRLAVFLYTLLPVADTVFWGLKKIAYILRNNKQEALLYEISLSALEHSCKLCNRLLGKNSELYFIFKQNKDNAYILSLIKSSKVPIDTLF